MDGLSTLNGSLRPRTGRNDWIRDLSTALAGYRPFPSERLHRGCFVVGKAVSCVVCACVSMARRARFMWKCRMRAAVLDEGSPPGLQRGVRRAYESLSEHLLGLGLGSDHSKLPKLLLQLELNLPWKAVKDGFDKTRPQFVERLAAVKNPADAVMSFFLFCTHACDCEREIGRCTCCRASSRDEHICSASRAHSWSPESPPLTASVSTHVSINGFPPWLRSTALVATPPGPMRRASL